MPKTGDWKYSNEQAYWLEYWDSHFASFECLYPLDTQFNAIMLILEHLIFCFSFQS